MWGEDERSRIMWIVTKYTIGFVYPQDYEAERTFKESNDMDGWTCHTSTLASAYSKESIYDIGSRADIQKVTEIEMAKMKGGAE